MKWCTGVLSVLICSAALFAGSAVDPVGDAPPSSVTPSPDLRFASVALIGQELRVQIRFVPGTFNPGPGVGTSRASLFLDTDQDVTTGAPGIASSGTIDNGVIGTEFILTIRPDGASLFEFIGPGVNQYAFRRNLPLEALEPNGFDILIPLADLGGDDGVADFKVVSTAQVSANGFTGILDVMPDVGVSPAAVFSDGSVTDPDDDAATSSVTPSPDLLFALAVATGSNLQVSIRLAEGSYNPVAGVGATSLTLLLDTDQDPDTGHPGVNSGGITDRGVIGNEFILTIGPDTASLRQYTGPPINQFAFRGTYPVTVTPDGPDIQIPLIDLNNDDGAVSFKVNSSAQVSASGFTGVLDTMPNVELAPGSTEPAGLPCPTPLSQVDPAAGTLDVAIKWVCLSGAPSCDDPGLVGQLTVRDMLLSRQEAAAGCIWIPQCNIALRSAALDNADLEGQFAQLDDPQTALGQPGDVVLCLPQQACPGQTAATPQPDVLAVWDTAASAWADVTKGIVAVNVNRIITPTGISIARGLVVPNLDGSIAQPWLLLADPTHTNEPNERTLAKMIGEILTLSEVTDTDNLMRPLTLGLEPGVLLTAAQCQQARDYLSSPEGMVLDPPARGPALLSSFADQVYDGLEPQVPQAQKYLDVVNSVVLDAGLAQGQVVFRSVLGGVVTPTGSRGQTTPLCVSFALDCDNNPQTGDNADLVVPGLDFAGAEFVAELLIDRRTMEVVPSLKAATGLGSFINVQFEPGVFQGQATNGVIRLVDPAPNYDGPLSIPFTTEARATLSSELFTAALAEMGFGPDPSGRTFPLGLRFQVATSEGAGQPAVDINPPDNVLLEFEDTPFAQLFAPPRVSPGQTVPVRVAGMPAAVPLRAVLGTLEIALTEVVTGPAGEAAFDLTVPLNAPLGQVQLTIAVDDTTTAVTADAVIRVALCPPDFDASGELTIFDFLAFQNIWQAGQFAADYDGDGELTIFDFLAFQNAFEQGCP